VWENGVAPTALGYSAIARRALWLRAGWSETYTRLRRRGPCVAFSESRVTSTEARARKCFYSRLIRGSPDDVYLTRSRGSNGGMWRPPTDASPFALGDTVPSSFRLPCDSFNSY
jgi:hypothetical protein